MSNTKYKPLELEDYQRDEQSKRDAAIVKAALTGDNSEIIEDMPVITIYETDAWYEPDEGYQITLDRRHAGLQSSAGGNDE